MAKNIKVNNVTYNSVSSISIPLAAGGGNAVFPDTSDADATTSDIMTGKTAYVNGAKITGTSTGGGGGTPVPVSPKDVNFYDYEGTLVAGYTIAEAQALSALPIAPDHSADDVPLTFQEWNYTLAQVNATTLKIDVGATYITTDGKTHLTINIAELGRMVVPLYFNQTVANGVKIDWGDGSLPETFTGTGSRNTTHTYSAAGTYDITLDVTSGVLGFGSNSSNYCVLGSTGDNGRVYCNMLKSVRIGNSVTTIGNYAFDYCYSLASVTIPNSVTTVGNSAFAYCYSLASVIIPNSVTKIGDYVFRNCYSLASVIIPNSVTTISNYAFYYCYSLASVTIPNSVTTIGNNAFAYCSALASVTIPNSVTTIGNYAFDYCYSLASVTIPNSVTTISNYAFDSCYSLASVTIPNSVTTVGNNAFAYCYSLASVIIPNSVTTISNYAFYYCYSLASVTIPNSVTTIGNNVFRNCYSLASVIIPNSVTTIGDYVFRNCYGMAHYYVYRTTPPILGGTSVFVNIPADCVIHVPAASLSPYQAATNWAAHATKMVGDL